VFFDDPAGEFAADESEAVEHRRREQRRLHGGSELGPGEEAADRRRGEGNERESNSKFVRHRSPTDIKDTRPPVGSIGTRRRFIEKISFDRKSLTFGGPWSIVFGPLCFVIHFANPLAARLRFREVARFMRPGRRTA